MEVEDGTLTVLGRQRHRTFGDFEAATDGSGEHERVEPVDPRHVDAGRLVHSTHIEVFVDDPERGLVVVVPRVDDEVRTLETVVYYPLFVS
ncbi:MAG: hypothetical protein WBV42_16000, partial [Haladaptatus sp.]